MTTAAEMVQLYTEAEAKVLKGQTVKMNGRELTRAKAATAAAKAAGKRTTHSLASFN